MKTIVPLVAGIVIGLIGPIQARSLNTIRSEGVLGLCDHPNSLPFASKAGDPPGFQVELGQALARHLVERHGVRHLLLTSRRGGAAIPTQQWHAVIQACGEALDAKCLDARRGELDRERQAVEFPANLDDKRSVRVGQREVLNARRDTFDE